MVWALEIGLVGSSRLQPACSSVDCQCYEHTTCFLSLRVWTRKDSSCCGSKQFCPLLVAHYKDARNCTLESVDVSGASTASARQEPARCSQGSWPQGSTSGKSNTPMKQAHLRHPRQDRPYEHQCGHAKLYSLF